MKLLVDNYGSTFAKVDTFFIEILQRIVEHDYQPVLYFLVLWFYCIKTWTELCHIILVFKVLSAFVNFPNILELFHFDAHTVCSTNSKFLYVEQRKTMVIRLSLEY